MATFANLGEDNLGEDNLGEDNLGEDNLGEDNLGEDNLGEERKPYPEATVVRVKQKIVCLSLGMAMAASSAIARDSDRARQDDLELTINDGFQSKDALRFEWPAISIGTGQYEAGPTGATVIRFNRRARVAVDARGGGPGTINSDYIAIGYPTAELDAIVLSGGTFYGLETATAVDTALLDDRARSGHWDDIGVVLGSIVYDMGGRRLNEIYPDKRLAQAALRAAVPGVFPRGAYGGGRSAISGGLWGCNAHSGQGAAYTEIEGIKVAVFTVVNALGVVTDRDGRVVACYKGENWPNDLFANDLLQYAPDSLRPGWPSERRTEHEKRNTTISVVATNHELTPVQLRRLAVQVHTSMSRMIQPFATEWDGDVLYAVSTGEVASREDDPQLTVEIGTIASELMWDAVLSAIPDQAPNPPVDFVDRQVMSEAIAIAGNYKFSEYARLHVREEGGRFFASATGERDVMSIARASETELVPVGKDEFAVPGRYPMVLKFVDRSIVINPGRWQQVGTKQD